jgi:signal peptidase I
MSQSEIPQSMPRRHKRWYALLGTIFILLLAISLWRGLSFFSTFQAFKIPTKSMEPTLEDGDHLFADMTAYNHAAPQRGDVAIFKYPKDESSKHIKRVIGLPGEKIEIIKRTVYIDNQPLKEPYCKYIDPTSIDVYYGPYMLPKDKYFLLGDNRDNSMDSRFFGFVDRSKFLGKARYLYLPKDIRRIGKQVE